MINSVFRISDDPGIFWDEGNFCHLVEESSCDEQCNCNCGSRPSGGDIDWWIMEWISSRNTTHSTNFHIVNQFWQWMGDWADVITQATMRLE